MTLLETPLHAWHASHGGRLVDFAGWSMPVQYGSIVDEHQATRNAIGLFDVSHMGRLKLTGPGAGRFLDRLLTRRVLDMPVGKIRYSLVTNEAGGILDDVLAYHLAEVDVAYRFLVVNASNREKIVAWIQKQLQPADETTLLDLTQETAMIAVQGPLANELLASLLPVDPIGMGYYTAVTTQLNGAEIIVSRTGYTGEDGCELIVPSNIATSLWSQILAAGEARGARAVGLGARDTLRLEAAMPLYGHELSETIDPLQAGLDFAVNFANREFIGKAAIAAKKNDPNLPRRVGLTLASRRVPREHYPVVADGQPIGEVTSGTFSPTLDRPLAMAYVPPAYATVGTEVAIDIRGKLEPATVVELPFYKRTT